jgi:transketolase
VVVPCDPAETRAATLWCTQQQQGPVYLRLGKAGEPDLTSGAPEPWIFGKLRYLKRGSEVCVLSYGPIMKMALDLAAKFEAHGASASVVSAHTLKPLDTEGVARALMAHGHVVVLEEMAPQGGLGSRVKEIAWDIRVSCRIDCFSLKDAFLHNYGSHAALLSAHGLDLDAICGTLGLA